MSALSFYCRSIAEKKDVALVASQFTCSFLISSFLRNKNVFTSEGGSTEQVDFCFTTTALRYGHIGVRVSCLFSHSVVEALLKSMTRPALLHSSRVVSFYPVF